MAQFRYQGRNRAGAATAGLLEATDSAAAAAQLVQMGMTPTQILVAAVPTLTTVRWKFGTSWFTAALPQEVLMTFCRQMHTLLRAGVPITRALAALHESSTHHEFGALLLNLRQKLEGGHELSSAMQPYPLKFDAYFLSMVRIGETTGRIDEIFLRLFEYLEVAKEMRQRVKSATRYPTFVVLAIALAIVVINVFVIPAFAGVYKGFHAELPLLTRVLIAFSDFTLHDWPWLLLAVGAAVFAFRSWVATVSGRLLWHRALLHAPAFGSLLHKAELARFARCLALALKSGVPITDALDASAQTASNQFVRARLEVMRVGIDRGESLSAVARVSAIFTPVVLQMIAVGEESGTLDELLAEVAQTYEGDVSYQLKTLSDAIEPILIVFLGGIVLLLALGVFMPMWDLGHAAVGAGGVH